MRASSIMAAADRGIICAVRTAPRRGGRSARSTPPMRWRRKRPASSGSRAASPEAARRPISSMPRSRCSSARIRGSRTASRPRARRCGKFPPTRIARSSSIDPRRTETAELADYHLQVRPGTDAFCLSAILAVMVQEDLIAHEFLQEHATRRRGAVRCAPRRIRIARLLRPRGIGETVVREVARRIARATGGVSVIEDLGIEMAPHSTLNSYLGEADFLHHRKFRAQGRDEPAYQHGAAGRRCAQGSAQPGRRPSHHRRHDSVQRHSRRNPHRSSEALPRDDHRERQPAAFARRSASACARRSIRSTPWSLSTLR